MAGRKPIQEEDEPKFLAALATMPLRDQARITLALNCGFRVREIMMLNVSHVLEHGQLRSHIRLERQHLKFGRSAKRKAIVSHCVPINPALRSVLEQYLFERFGSGAPVTDGPLFPSRNRHGRLSRWRANMIIREVLSRAGIGNPELYGTHSLRKAFCRSVYQGSGFDLMVCKAAMGHASVTSTEKYLPVSDWVVENLLMNLGRRKLSTSLPQSRPVTTAQRSHYLARGDRPSVPWEVDQ